MKPYLFVAGFFLFPLYLTSPLLIADEVLTPVTSSAAPEIALPSAAPIVPLITPPPAHAPLPASISSFVSESQHPVPDTLAGMTRVYAQKMRREYRLFWAASRGLEKSPIDRIFLAFDFYQVRTVQEIRKLLVILVESYLETINASPTPELGHYPFTADDIDIEIHIDCFHGEYVDRQFVEWVELKNGLVCYQAYNCMHGKFCFVRKERYDQAFHFAELDFAEEAEQIKAAKDQIYHELEFEGTVK